MFVYHSCFPPHPFPLSTWPKAHCTVSSHCSASQQLPCTSLTHVIKLNGPSCQDLDEGQDGPSCRQMCQHDGLLGYVKVGSRHASCLDKVAVLAWVADVPSMCHHVGGRCASCCWSHCCHPELGLS